MRLPKIALSLMFSCLVVGLAHLASQPSFAQVTLNPTEATLTAMPPRLGDDGSIKAKPGQKIQLSVRVRNGSDQTINVSSLAQDFIVDEDGETPIPVDSEVSNRWSLASWMILTPDFQELSPREIGTITAIIEVPEDALPGGHYAMIVHQPTFGDRPGSTITNDDSPEDISASKLQQRVGTLLYVVVDGPINEHAFIRDFNIPSFTEYGPVPFSFMVDNQSDIHIRPQIGVEIYNLFGKKIDTIAIEQKNVFPFVGRKFDSQWDRVWGFGPYTAKIIMSYGTEGQVAVAIASFWLLPIRLVIAAVVILLALIAVGVVIRRHLKHRKMLEMQEFKQWQEKIKNQE